MYKKTKRSLHWGDSQLPSAQTFHFTPPLLTVSGLLSTFQDLTDSGSPLLRIAVGSLVSQASFSQGCNTHNQVLQAVFIMNCSDSVLEELDKPGRNPLKFRTISANSALHCRVSPFHIVIQETLVFNHDTEVVKLVTFSPGVARFKEDVEVILFPTQQIKEKKRVLVDKSMKLQLTTNLSLDLD